MQKILTALHAAMGEIGQVRKGKTNTFHGYKYAGEEEIIEEVRPMLLKHGLMLIPSLDGDARMDEHGNTHVVMSYTLAHVSGETIPNIRIPGCGNDRSSKGVVGDKGTYKALTGANKYALMKLLMIATSDDPENDSHDLVSVGERVAHPLAGEPLEQPRVGLGVDTQLGQSRVAQPTDPVSQAGASSPQDLFDVAAAFVEVCASKRELEDYWKGNVGPFEGTLKQADRGLYNKLLDKFKAKKKELTK